MPVRHASPMVDGAELRLVRQERGLNVTDAAAKCGISKEYLSSIERGRRPTVAPATFNRICQAFDVERSRLLLAIDDEAA